MNRQTPSSPTRRAIVGAPLLALASSSGQETGFTPLFDGRSLKGWSVKDGPESAFYVDDGAIVIHQGSGYPAWLRSDREYENFDFRCDFHTQGWSDSGIYLHAPEHGRNTWTGMQVKLFHQVDDPPNPYSVGSIFPVVAPQKVNVKPGWNSLQIRVDWPSIRVWTNGELVQDANTQTAADLRYRLRRGYLGISSLSYPLRFRNLQIRELPSTDKWQVLYDAPEHLEANWWQSEGEPNFQALGGTLRGDGLGHIATKEKFRDFALQLYIRGARAHNGGVLFRSEGKGLKGKRFEIQLHNVPDAHFPTGSLYYYKRAMYPRIEDEQWYLMQVFVTGSNALIRINGENVLEYDKLDNLQEGYIELQAHRKGYWLEFKKVMVKRL
jgi:hypothetical protein